MNYVVSDMFYVGNPAITVVKLWQQKLELSMNLYEQNIYVILWIMTWFENFHPGSLYCGSHL